MAEIAMRAVLAKDVGRFTVVLAPASEFADEQTKRLPRDKDLAVDARARRNMRQHNLYWALMGLIANASDKFHDGEEASDYCKFKIKHVEARHNPVTGLTYLVPKSMSEASMSAEQFKRYFNRIVHVVLTDIVPGLKESELRAEIERIVSPNYDRSEVPRR